MALAPVVSTSTMARGLSIDHRRGSRANISPSSRSPFIVVDERECHATWVMCERAPGPWTHTTSRRIVHMTGGKVTTSQRRSKVGNYWVYDGLGKNVTTLVNRDGLSSGTFYYSLSTGPSTQTGRMVISSSHGDGGFIGSSQYGRPERVGRPRLRNSEHSIVESAQRNVVSGKKAALPLTKTGEGTMSPFCVAHRRMSRRASPT